MKSKLLLAIVLLVSSLLPAMAQSKKELEAALTQMTASKDSLQKLYTSLSATYDSINKAYLSYDAMAKVIREKVIHADFDPKNADRIIDSLNITRDSVIFKLKAKMDAYRDSARIAIRISDSLRNEIAHLVFVVNKYVSKGTIPLSEKDFSGTWSLTVRWYELADDSVQSGFILKPTPPDLNPVSWITFIDVETAMVGFSKGDSIRCFYKISGFTTDKPYFIDLNRENKVNIRLNVNPFDGEFYVSFRKDKGYFYGFMRKP